MSAKQTSSEQESLEVAEDARQKEWKQPSFMKEMFLGRFRLDLIHPFPVADDRPEFVEFFDKLKTLLREKADPVQIDAEGEYPPELVQELKELGAFGMKVPRKYDGLGFSQAEYSRVMELLGSYDGNVTALLSAHQSIGIPQPVKLFGTEELRQKYLPQCAAGAISAFALTEEEVGSDPAKLTTVAELTPEGDAYILNGEKLWCTNGTLADLLVVMARDPKSKKKISAFVVETAWPGVTLEHRCRFMGLRALANGVISFKDVRVPVENIIGKPGAGLKIALVTLNTGRLSLPACAVGAAKWSVGICREWASKRVQWGLPVGKHEAIAHKLADMAATTFAMESLSDLAAEMSDRGGYDIRLEAAAAKEWDTVMGWRIADETMQIRGGRGYETEVSLAARGEEPIGVERMMRDARINTIFEGSSEIMHLFMAREAVDKHLEVAGKLINPKLGLGAKLAALPGIGLFYLGWYPTRWLGWGRWPRYAGFGRLATHLRFAQRSCRKLARESFHGMVVYGPKLQRRQGFLFRLVDVANELFAMSATISRAQRMLTDGHPDGRKAVQLADLFCRESRRRVKASFRGLWHNDDVFKYDVSRAVLGGEHAWVEEGIVGESAAASKPESREPAPVS